MTAQAGDTLIPSRDCVAGTKATLRSHLRAIRKAVSRAVRKRAARQAANHVLKRLRPRSRIAIYLSVHSELSTAPLLAGLRRKGHRVYAPVTMRNSRMRFVHLRANTPLRRCPMGLPQPVSPRSACSVRRLDVVVLPLLGFDADGGRIGNGGGYYDRALAGTRIGRKPLRIGYAYAAQEVASIPCEPFDVRLDGVVTERGWRRFHSSDR